MISEENILGAYIFNSSFPYIQKSKSLKGNNCKEKCALFFFMESLVSIILSSLSKEINIIDQMRLHQRSEYFLLFHAGKPGRCYRKKVKRKRIDQSQNWWSRDIENAVSRKWMIGRYQCQDKPLGKKWKVCKQVHLALKSILFIKVIHR